MSITIPSQKNKKWIQTNNSDVFGSIYSSFNLDVQENYGRLRIGKRMILNTANSDVASLYCPIAFWWHNSTIYAFGGSTSADGKAFKAGIDELQSNYVADVSANAPGDIDSRYSDAVSGSNGNLYCTSPTKLYECNSSGTWSATTGTLTTATPHMLAVYASRLYVTNLQNKIYSADISTTTMGSLTTSGSYTLALGLDSDANTITKLLVSTSRIWILTVNTKGGKGYVHEWDGQSTLVTRSYRLDSSGALAGVIKDDVPYIIDTNGDERYWNGASFVKVVGFNRKRNKYRLTNCVSYRNDRFIHPNGMTIVDNRINILINNLNNDNAGTVEESIPSGVHEQTQENGLIHKYSLGLSKSSDTIIDYGQVRLAQVGAITEIIVPHAPTSNKNGTFLVGANIYTDATTVKRGIWYEDTNDTLEKSGIYVSPQIEANGAKDIYQKITTKYKRMLSAGDRFVIKTRNHDIDAVEATITWTSTTTFTVPNSSVVVSNYWTSGTGGEVEVIQGLGSGKNAHITNATLNTGTWTVTVDETFVSATGTSKARFGMWTKMGEVSGIVEQVGELSVPKTEQTDIYFQFKVWILFTGKNEIHSFNLISGIHKPLN